MREQGGKKCNMGAMTKQGVMMQYGGDDRAGG